MDFDDTTVQGELSDQEWREIQTVALASFPLAWIHLPRRPAGSQPAELARCDAVAPAGSGSSSPL